MSTDEECRHTIGFASCEYCDEVEFIMHDHKPKDLIHVEYTFYPFCPWCGRKNERPEWMEATR